MSNNYNVPKNRMPDALINTEFLYNPVQLLPFLEIFGYDKEKGWEWNGKNLIINDESAVGKTVEALIILREFLRKAPDSFTALIICEEYCYKKWYDELKKAGLYSNKRNLFPQQFTVTTYDKLENTPLPPKIDLIIADNAEVIFDSVGRISDAGEQLEKLIKNYQKACLIFMTCFGSKLFLKKIAGENTAVTSSRQEVAINYKTEIIEKSNAEEANVKEALEEIFENEDKAIIFLINESVSEKIKEEIKDCNYSIFNTNKNKTLEENEQAKKSFEKTEGKAVLIINVNYVRPTHDIMCCCNVIFYKYFLDMPSALDELAFMNLRELNGRKIKIYNLTGKGIPVIFGPEENKDELIYTTFTVNRWVFGIDDYKFSPINAINHFKNARKGK